MLRSKCKQFSTAFHKETDRKILPELRAVSWQMLARLRRKKNMVATTRRLSTRENKDRLDIRSRTADYNGASASLHGTAGRRPTGGVILCVDVTRSPDH